MNNVCLKQAFFRLWHKNTFGSGDSPFQITGFRGVRSLDQMVRLIHILFKIPPICLIYKKKCCKHDRRKYSGTVAKSGGPVMAFVRGWFNNVLRIVTHGWVVDCSWQPLFCLIIGYLVWRISGPFISLPWSHLIQQQHIAVSLLYTVIQHMPAGAVWAGPVGPKSK